MKKSLLMISLLSALAGYSYAMPEEGHRPPPMPLEKLNLSNQQQEKLSQLMDKHRVAIDKLHEQHQARHEQEQEEVEKLMDNQRKELSTVLTADQMTKFDKMHKAAHRGECPRPEHHRGI